MIIAKVRVMQSCGLQINEFCLLVMLLIFSVLSQIICKHIFFDSELQ